MPSRETYLVMWSLISTVSCMVYHNTFVQPPFINTTLQGNVSSPLPELRLAADFLVPIEGQTMILLEFDEITRNAFESFNGIFWGSGPRNESNITLAIPNLKDDSQMVDVPANYAHACDNTTMIFKSSLIFMNCLTLGITSVLLENGVIAINPNSVEYVNDYLGFGSLGSFNGTAVLDHISTCLVDTCRNSTTVSCDAGVAGNLSIASNPVHGVKQRLHGLYMGTQLYCDGAASQANADVIGPGVSVSLILDNTVGDIL
ncbi:hypothetical protein F5Y16DRAFT_416984 [Xylariaceae sp. FL0255]|nr:hypothetical protein F5Y16DRAFT_416984 [Xylariaceae sp. FL0255]